MAANERDGYAATRSFVRYVFILLPPPPPPLMTTMKARTGLKGGNERRALSVRGDATSDPTGLDGLLAADLNGALIGDIRGRKGARQAG